MSRPISAEATFRAARDGDGRVEVTHENLCGVAELIRAKSGRCERHGEVLIFILEDPSEREFRGDGSIFGTRLMVAVSEETNTDALLPGTWSAVRILPYDHEVIEALKVAAKAMHADTSAKGKADYSVVRHALSKYHEEYK